MEIIRMVEDSDLSVKRTLEELDVSTSGFYEWYGRYRVDGYDGLCHAQAQCEEVLESHS